MLLRAQRLQRLRCVLQARRPASSEKSFDSYKVGEALKEAGFTKAQAELVLKVVQDAMAASRVTATELLATKENLIALKGELSEKVFNSTMKFDISQRHTREIMERDLTSLKADLRSHQRQELSLLQTEIANLEKRTLERRELDEHKFSMIQNEIAQVEKRTLQYGAGFMATLLGLLLTAARVFDFSVTKHGGSHEPPPPPPPAPAAPSPQYAQGDMYNDVRYAPRTNESDAERPPAASRSSRIQAETVAVPLSPHARATLTAQELVDLASAELNFGGAITLQHVGGVERVTLDWDELSRLVQDAAATQAHTPAPHTPRPPHQPQKHQSVDSITPQVRV